MRGKDPMPKWEGDSWWVRLRNPDGGRQRYRLPDVPRSNEPLAMAVALKLRDELRRVVPAERGETFREYAARWLESRAHLSSVKVNGYELGHVPDAIGLLPIVAIERRHMQELVLLLDKKVRAGDISWKWAGNVWSTVRKLFADARSHKDPALQVRDSNPTLEVAPPDRGVEKAKQFLYPSEMLQLLRCDDVPLRWRRLFAIAAYSGIRLGELSALTWDDVDLERRVIVVHTSMNRSHKFGEIGPTKTKSSRRYSIDAELVPLLQYLRRRRVADGLVIRVPRVRAMASRFRAYLVKAGVRRKALHARGATSRPITHHDLRATYLTWQSLRGHTQTSLQARAGHAKFSTTEIYLREAAALDGAELGLLFPPLPPELFGGDSAQNPGPPGGGTTTIHEPKRAPDMQFQVLPPEPNSRGISAVSGPLAQNWPNSNPVELALAEALVAAAHAREWKLVAELAGVVDRRTGREADPPSERTLLLVKGGRA